MKQITTIVLSVIIGLLSGVGATQVWIVGDVRKHDVQIQGTQRELDNLVRLIEAQLETERELIQLVRTQNELLQRKT